MSDEQIERVAKAMWDVSGKSSEWHEADPHLEEIYRSRASAAIAAMQPTPQEGVAGCPGYSPDIQAMGDCRHCGHTAQSHTDLRTIAGETTNG